jgi:hypothetical protein
MSGIESYRTRRSLPIHSLPTVYIPIDQCRGGNAIMSAVPRSIWSMRASSTSPRTWPQDARPRGVRFVVAVLIDVFRAAPPLVC